MYFVATSEIDYYVLTHMSECYSHPIHYRARKLLIPVTVTVILQEQCAHVTLNEHTIPVERCGT